MADINCRKRGSKWEYYFEGAKVDGKRKRISKGGFDTKKSALEAGVKALNEYNNSGLHFVPSELSYSDYLDYWLENYCKVNLKSTTYEGYVKKIRLYIKPALGKYKLRALTSATLQEFINTKFNEGFSRNTLSALKGILSGSIGYAVEPLRFIQANPMLYVKLPLKRATPNTATRTKSRRAITKEELDIIFNRFPEGHTCHIPLQLAYRCGMRLGEAFAITWDDVDFDNATIDINKQVQNNNKVWEFTPPKYDSYRKIKVDKTLLELLRKTKARQLKAKDLYEEHYTHYYENSNRELITNKVDDTCNEIELVNRRDDGTYIQPRVMQHCSRVIHYDLNIKDFDYHSLRHTHVTKLVEAGANPKDVQFRLGHKDIKVTLEIYAELTEKMQVQSLDIIENIF
ncbi:site-specific integrase [Anaerosporobacter faecicola]|uniref:site-specific integrase n=1 Tax=Anaerosporobacter faecicola TaxID=2718714 RepID=UPI0014388D7E|nr:site-specific integrase [Anaerosporobacter faecicola]